MVLPEGVPEANTIVKLKKAQYGMKAAPRSQYKTIGAGVAGASGAGIGRRLDPEPSPGAKLKGKTGRGRRHDRTKGEEDDEAVARTGPNGRRVTSPAP